MTESPSHPSRRLKFVAGCARWALGALLVFWLLLAAAWAGLHGWIVPRISDFRPQLEQRAQRALGVPVRIAGISARSEGVFPTVELTGVALLDAQGREALRLPRVVVALSPRSLLRFGFEQIYIEGPELDVRRAADGRIFVAGLAFRESGDAGSGAADWLFAQPEVAIRGGLLRWTDEQRGAAPLALSQVDLVLRGGGWRHGVRLDATPPPEWGDRFTLRGRFRQPLLTTHGGDWRRWSGQLFADFSRVDVSRLNQYADLGALQVARGHGALRAWVDVQRGQIAGGTADVALGDVQATLDQGLPPLVLSTVTGRLGGRWLDGGFEFDTRGLQFLTGDGLRWPGGNLSLRHTGRGQPGEQGELQADRLDLAALSQIAASLPLGDELLSALRTYAPQGLVAQVQAGWHGPLAAPRQYQARGRVEGLALAAGDGAPTVAGLSGATVDFDLTQTGGRAVLAMEEGALLLPGVFEDPVVPVQRLGATVRWQIDGGRIAVQAPDLRFANADAEGEAKLGWNTSAGGARLPGVLDLSGRLTRADATRVHRYLPLAVDAEARHYVRDAIQAGSASQVQFRVKGELNDFPYAHGGPGQARPGQTRPGEFYIAARVKDVAYRYVPPALLEAGDKPWPALAGLSGELVFDRASMAVRDAAGSFAGMPRLRAQKLGARIADLEHAVVEVTGGVSGPLADMLALVKGSHIAQLTEGALDEATATGAAQLQLGLNLPIAHINKSTVRGSVTLAGNDVRFVPAAPLVSGARGVVRFSDTGFALEGVAGRALGGEVQLSGGMPGGGPAGEVAVRAQGTATAEGLRGETGLGALLPGLARHASGSAAYTLALGVRRGVAQVQVATDLVGMALALPAPLGKAAQAPMPVRFDNRLTPAAAASPTAPLHDQVTLELGSAVRLDYVRALEGEHARVLRGLVTVGLPAGERAPLPDSGVDARAVFGALDADAWRALLPSASSTAAPAPAAAPDVESGYLPTRVNVRADTLTLHGRTLHGVKASATQDGDGQGTVWRGDVEARELAGYLEYRPAGAGRLHARLSRLAIPQAAPGQDDAAAALLDDPGQPGQLPALDIMVEDFELRGRRLGRIEIEADSHAVAGGQREWRLAKLNLAAPEAVFTSHGRWASASGGGRTALDFALDIHDSGALLARFGMDGVIRNGKGRMQGQVGWQGSPLSPDYRSMEGELNVNMQQGQFLKADPGLAKLLSVLSLQSLPRRFALDFRDVFSQGFAFDFVRGDVRIAQGVAHTNNLQMKGVNAAVLMEGSADIEHETQQLHVVVVPEINAMTASLVATAINPVIGLGSFLAQMFLRGPLIQAATQEFRIDGTWADPRVERIDKK